MLCICARVVSTICSGQPSARAAAASFSMTCSLFFSLLLAVSMRQVDIASKAAFTALRASSESAGAHVGLKLRGVTSAYLFCMAASPLTDCKDPLGGPRGQRPSSVLLKVSQWPVNAPGASLLCLSSFDVLLGGARPRCAAKIAFIGSLIGAQDAKPASHGAVACCEPRLANISGTELTDSG